MDASCDPRFRINEDTIQLAIQENYNYDILTNYWSVTMQIMVGLF